VHPDWLVGTIVHLLKFGMPPLDGLGQPLAFFSRIVHDQCPRFADYEREKFAATFSGEGCLFRLGCQGPLTKADCMLRFQNSRTSTCIRAGAPCIGCASPNFSAKAGFPLFLKDRDEAAGGGGKR
jgi:hydrogenase small subunit